MISITLEMTPSVWEPSSTTFASVAASSGAVRKCAAGIEWVVGPRFEGKKVK